MFQTLHFKNTFEINYGQGKYLFWIVWFIQQWTGICYLLRRRRSFHRPINHLDWTASSTSTRVHSVYRHVNTAKIFTAAVKQSEHVCNSWEIIATARDKRPVVTCNTTTPPTTPFRPPAKEDLHWSRNHLINAASPLNVRKSLNCAIWHRNKIVTARKRFTISLKYCFKRNIALYRSGIYT